MAHWHTKINCNSGLVFLFFFGNLKELFLLVCCVRLAYEESPSSMAHIGTANGRSLQWQRCKRESATEKIRPFFIEGLR